MKKVICIGREFGSGGHEVAVRLAEYLGIKVYEREILHLACKYGEVPMKSLEKADEKATNPYLFETIHEGNYHVLRGMPTSEVLFSLQSHEIKRIAAREDCIFVGRCADYVLRDSDVRLFSAFISAPFDYRVQRKMEQEKLSQEKAKRLVKKIDKQRKKYYEGFTGRKWGNPDNYDLYIDMGKCSMEQAVWDIAEQYGLL